MTSHVWVGTGNYAPLEDGWAEDLTHEYVDCLQCGAIALDHNESVSSVPVDDAGEPMRWCWGLNGEHPEGCKCFRCITDDGGPQ